MLEQSSFAKQNSVTLPLPSDVLAEGHIRLILVDDDDDFREAVGAELSDYGFEVIDFDDSQPLFDYFAAGSSADVIVLDWNLPTTNGIDILPQLRRQGTAYEMTALDRGALDFIDKSRGVQVLAKRAKLIAEASKLPPDIPTEEIIEVGSLTLRPRLCRAYWQGTDVNLTVTEFNIIRRLVDNAGDHVSYRAIYDCVHHCGFIAGSGEDGYRTNVRSSVKRIRNKFRAIDPEFMEIENFPAFGYCWKTRSPALV
jgi:two-component system response regulator ChvI